MEKRKSCRGIVFIDDQIMLMKRLKDNVLYYVIPGGGIEADESHQECLEREMLEEMGVLVSPIRLVYEYQREDVIHYYYLCAYKEGTFGTGTGPEFTSYSSESGSYTPVMPSMDEVADLNLVPLKVKEQLMKDYQQYGILLDIETKIIIE